MYRRYWFGLVLVALVASLLLAACGGGADESEPAPPAGEAAASSGEAAAAPAAPAGDAEKGKEIFNTTCFACHGEGGVGVQGLGKDMTTSTFIAGLSDEDLLAFIKQGRDPSSPDNTTGVAMPPKGGNPALTDEQLMDVIAYIRTLHK